MSGATSYACKKIVDDLTGVTPYTWPALYLSALTADPGAAGSHASEISGGGYARQPLTGVMGAADPVTGISVNTSVITFGPSSADWGTVMFFGVEDSSVAGAGNMVIPGVPATPRTIGTGQPLQIPIGRLQLRMIPRGA